MRPQDPSQSLSFLMKCTTAGVAGGIGGLVGLVQVTINKLRLLITRAQTGCRAPADLINVRMQNDSKLLPDARRNYKNAIEGLVRVSREEGVLALWKGSSMVLVRAVLMTIGQLSFYDQVKQMLVSSGLLKDNVPTHLLASSIAVCMCSSVSLILF
jgi:Mitochondrial carrier protein